MNKQLENKVDKTIDELKKAWSKVRNRNPFIAFSTGKDSLLVASLLYEAVAPKRPLCLYSHHPLEFQCNLDYLETLKERFDIHIVEPFLDLFTGIESRNRTLSGRSNKKCCLMVCAITFEKKHGSTQSIYCLLRGIGNKKERKSFFGIFPKENVIV